MSHVSFNYMSRCISEQYSTTQTLDATVHWPIATLFHDLLLPALWLARLMQLVNFLKPFCLHRVKDLCCSLLVICKQTEQNTVPFVNFNRLLIDWKTFYFFSCSGFSIFSILVFFLREIMICFSNWSVALEAYSTGRIQCVNLSALVFRSPFLIYS